MTISIMPLEPLMENHTQLFYDSPRRMIESSRCKACRTSPCNCFQHDSMAILNVQSNVSGKCVSLDLDTPPSSPTREKGRRVRFARHPTTKSFACEFHPCPWPFPETQKERNALWYSNMEFRLFKKECRRHASSEQATEYRQQFQHVYNACDSAEGLRGIRTADSAQLCSADYRGLEMVLFSKLKARRTIVATVTEAHQQGFCEADVAVISRGLTIHARRMARVLGTGDAYVAQGEIVARRVSATIIA